MLKKLLTALRGAGNEAGEVLLDGQALRILDQEIRDAGAELERARGALAEIVAKRKLADERMAGTRRKIAEYEAAVAGALDKGDEALARDVAGRVAVLEEQAAGEEETAKAYAGSEAELRRSVAQIDVTLKRLKQQADAVRATDSVQRAQAAVSSRTSGATSSLQDAVQSLERLKERQKLQAARFEAAAEIAAEGGDDLDARLRAAGLKSAGPSADDVLERVRGRKPAAS